MAENAVALRMGEQDAIQVFQPCAEELLQSNTGHLWYAAADRGLTAYTTLVTRRSVVLSRRDELAAMVRAMDRTLRWIAGTQGAEIARALAAFFPDVPAPIYAAAIDRYRSLKLYAIDPMTRREGVERLQQAMRSGGVLDRSIPFEQVVDNSLAQVVVTTTG
jgi:NitT/TauT family transport system substrate-binding protein